MGRGLGIASLVLSIISIFVPGVTIYVVMLAMALATFSGLSGEKPLTISSLVISIINIAFLSPLTWVAIAGESLHEGATIKWLIAVAFIAPIIGIIVGSSKERQRPPKLQSPATNVSRHVTTPIRDEHEYRNQSVNTERCSDATTATINEFSGSDTNDASPSSYCTACGAVIPVSSAFCGKCGAPLRVVAMTSGAPVPIPDSASNMKISFALGGIILLTIIGVGGGVYLAHRSKAETQLLSKQISSATEQNLQIVKPQSNNTFLTLEPFTVNLAHETGEQFLQATLSLQLSDQHQAEVIKAYMPLVRSRLLRLLSSKKASELSSEEGKKRLADEIARELQLPFTQNVEPQNISAVFFTSFVIQ